MGCEDSGGSGRPKIPAAPVLSGAPVACDTGWLNMPGKRELMGAVNGTPTWLLCGCCLPLRRRQSLTHTYTHTPSEREREREMERETESVCEREREREREELVR